MTLGLVFSPEAERQLVEIQAYVADHSSVDRAHQYVERILVQCERLTDFPLLGSARDDIRPGLRTLGFERRAVIAFVPDEQRVAIVGIYYGGRQWEPSIAAH